MDTEAELTQRGHSSPEQGEGRSRSAVSRSWRRAGVLGVVCTVFLLLVANLVVQPFLIPSRSMEPTLEVGDRILVNKLAYRFGATPQRGDVVVFDGTGSFVREPARGNPVGDALHGPPRRWGWPIPPTPTS